MNQLTHDPLNTHILDWLMAGIIGAALSLIFSPIASGGSGLRWVMLVLFVGVFVSLLLYAYRCRHLLKRLGVVKILKRDNNREVDWPTNAQFSYRFVGLSAVNMLTDDCCERLKNQGGPEKIELIHLDPNCKAALHRIAEIEGREAERLKENIEHSVRTVKSFTKQEGPVKMTLVPHPMIPSLRVVTIDNKTMYVGEYASNSTGFSSDLIVLRKVDGHMSLFSIFQKYCDRVCERALYHLILLAVVRIKSHYPSLSGEQLKKKVTEDLHEQMLATHVSPEVVDDILCELGLDNAIVS